MIAKRPGQNQNIAFGVPPGRVRSLWDMFAQFGLFYLLVGNSSCNARKRLEEWADRFPDTDLIVKSQPPFQDVKIGLETFKTACRLLPVGTLEMEVDRLLKEIETGVSYCRQASHDIMRLYQRLQDELLSHWFFHIDPALRDFYEQEALFGAVVGSKFKDAKSDIKSAGSCLALGQPTACVLHLMRAMEAAMGNLSKRLHKPIPPKATWNSILKDMNHAIDRMPEATAKQKRKKDAWSEASANLFHVGEAWRNPTMHPRRSYTTPQAKEVIEAVRVFMTSLAKL